MGREPDLDLGGGVTATFFRYLGREDQPAHAGILLEHAAPTGACYAAVHWWRPPEEVAAGKPVWTLNSLEPLDLSPSIRCSCGFHGYVRQGRWVGA